LTTEKLDESHPPPGPFSLKASWGIAMRSRYPMFAVPLPQSNYNKDHERSLGRPLPEQVEIRGRRVRSVRRLCDGSFVRPLHECWIRRM